MPTPIDGKFGPSISKSLMNILLPIADNPSFNKTNCKLFERRKKTLQQRKI